MQAEGERTELVRQLREMHTYASEAGDASAALAAAAAAQQEAEPASPFVGAAAARGAFLVPKLEPGCSAADPGSPSRSNVSNSNALNGGGGAVTTGGHAPVVPQGGGAPWCSPGSRCSSPSPPPPAPPASSASVRAAASGVTVWSDAPASCWFRRRSSTLCQLLSVQVPSALSQQL
jgi:hypothetical protein